MTIKGYATLEGTTRYRDRLKGRAAENHFRLEQDLWLSSIGLGTYLGSHEEWMNVRYTESVMRSVELGVNVIDTAANYRFQQSERAVGAGLRHLIEDNICKRDEIVVCTKGGYLPFDGEPPIDVRRYIEDTFIRPGIAEAADIVSGHCMTPRYLQSQIDQSLGNIGVATLDVYYLHNPESQLSAVGRPEFEAKLRAAFESLEKNIAEGKIKMYGVATWNGFRVPQAAREYIPLETIFNIAREVGGAEHGFRFIQLPLNLAMPEALTSANQSVEGEQLSVLEAASALGVTVVASASLLQGKVAHGLPNHVREPLGSLATDAQTAIQFVRSTPGVTTALIGMSDREHVEENLQLVRVARTSPEDFQRLFGENE